MIKQYKKFLFFLVAMSFGLFYACRPSAQKYSSPKGYDLAHGEKFNMPESLLEISGIAFHKGDGKKLYSVQDEDGKLFLQDWGVKKQVHVKFAPKGDFEDLALIDDRVFVLKSSGTIYAFPLQDIGIEEVKPVKEWKGKLPKGEYESIYADEKAGLLYVLCKECKVDKKSDDVSGYLLKYDQEGEVLLPAGEFRLNIKELEALGKKVKSALKPSALSRHPATGEWYILSSVAKMLIIATPEWKIKEAHRLSPSDFSQPEGMAFDSDNNLYICNEGDELSSGNVLKFKYNVSN